MVGAADLAAGGPAGLPLSQLGRARRQLWLLVLGGFAEDSAGVAAGDRPGAPTAAVASP
jgi:hypothetical protein